jgi:hypothetical protein
LPVAGFDGSEGAKEPVALDHLALTPPRVARFIASLSEGIPVWIACRSDAPREIGRVWEYLYKFVRVEVPPLTPHEAQVIIEHAVAIGSIQPEAKAHANHLCRQPRFPCQLCTNL